MSGNQLEGLKGILKWSLSQQQDGCPSSPSSRTMDSERKKFLQDTMKDLCAQPTHTDILRAALAVLKTHYSDSLEGDVALAMISRLEETFEQLQYLIEDMDNASDLIPLGGVDILLQYLDHSNHVLVRLTCESVATASQNNPKCQQAFFTAIPKLLHMVKDTSQDVISRTKALYAVSNLMRDFLPGREEFFKNDGLSAVLLCVGSGDGKLVIKAMFLLEYCYTSGSEDELKGHLESVTTQCADVAEEVTNVHVLSHMISLLLSIARTCHTECCHWRLTAEKKAKSFHTLLKDKCHQFGIENEEETAELLISSLFQ